jgi:hypothetical protein
MNMSYNYQPKSEYRTFSLKKISFWLASCQFSLPKGSTVLKCLVIEELCCHSVFVLLLCVCLDFFICFVFSFRGARVWTRARHLLGNHYTSWASPPALFVVVILEIGSHFMSRPTWTMIPLFYASCCSQDDRYMPPCPTIGWDGISWTFLPRLISKCSLLDLNLTSS